MTTPRTIDNYGGAFEDAEPVENPTTEQSADYGNRLHEDVAQLTRVPIKAWCKFFPTATAAPTTVVATAGRSHMGTGSGNLPTIAKSATGTYSLTYASSFEDGLGEDETVSFVDGFILVNGGSSDAGASAQIVSIVSNVVIIKIYDETFAATDLNSGSAWVSVFLL
jgi:hypothetical protein